MALMMVALGCAPDETANPAYCESNRDCSSGTCYRHLCVTSSDGGGVDTGTADTSAPDSAPVDTGTTDTGSADTGSADAGCPAARVCEATCCNMFETCCNDKTAGPTCVDLTTSEEHCGECNHGCSLMLTCNDGRCISL